MSIYYIKQDNTVWCCEEDSGPYQEQIEETFVKCECESVWSRKEIDVAKHLQGHAGGGEVLKWRIAKRTELAAWYSGGDDAFQEGVAFAENRIIKLLESKLCWCVGQPLNKDNGREELMKHINCDWKAMMIEYHVALIKGEQK